MDRIEELKKITHDLFLQAQQARRNWLRAKEELLTEQIHAIDRFYSSEIENATEQAKKDRYYKAWIDCVAPIEAQLEHIARELGDIL